MPFGLNVKPEHGYYVESEPLNGTFADAALLDETRDEGVNPRGRTFTAGRPIRGTNLPTKMRSMDRKKHPMSDFDASTLLNVSDRAKSLIEAFEPDVHQFFPVEFVDIDGKHPENRWFLIICNRLDSVSREKTEGMILSLGRMWRPARDLMRRYPEEIPEGFDLTREPKIVFSTEKIGDAKIWRDKHVSTEAAYLADDLANAIDREGLTGLRLQESRAASS